MFARILKERLSRASRDATMSRSMRLWIWAGVIFFSLNFASVTSWYAYQARVRALESAYAMVQNLALVLDEQAVRTTDALGMLLRVSLHDPARPGSEMTSPLVAELSAGMPHVRSVKVANLDSARTIAADGGAELTDAIDLEAVEAHRRNPDLGLHISRPVRDQTNEVWQVSFSRKSAAFAEGDRRIAIAHVSVESLQRLFDNLDVGRDGSIVLFRADATLLARAPYHASHVGRSYPQAALFRELERASAGVYETDSATDGVNRIVAYRRIQDTPLIVVAAQSKSEVLSDWTTYAQKSTVLVLGAIAILLGFGLVLTRETRHRDEAEAQAREKSNMLEATLDNMDQGLLLIDADGTVPLCNRRAVDLLDLPPNLMASRPKFEDVRTLQLEREEFAKSGPELRDWVAKTGVDKELHTYERERPNGTVLEIRTVPLAEGGAVRTYTDITARKDAERRITHMARHDALTDLPNRVLFRERLGEAVARVKRRGESFALLCLDLDQFKAVNDTLGHPVGDALLQAVSKRIKATLRDEDTVARLGGDEFAILLLNADKPQHTSTVARRLVESIGEPYVINGAQLNIGVSIGIAIAPDDGLDPDALMKHADLALYRSKAEGRNTFRFFEAGMDALVQARRALELDLREALARSEFRLHYQPFMDLARNEVVGFEALLRWGHPVRGFVSPGEFIAIAEETNLIVPIGEWVLRQACQEAARWPEDVRIAVNVSAAQLRNQSLVATVMSALAGSGLPAGRLELEITESVLMQESEASRRSLHQLRDLGVRICLDDFGTGYSSLSYLRSFPFDKIKIDRSFMPELGQNPDCDAIVRAIIGLGKSLDTAITAEGVESEAQLAFIRAEGCTEMQGYLLSAPKPADEILGFMPERARVDAA